MVTNGISKWLRWVIPLLAIAGIIWAAAQFMVVARFSGRVGVLEAGFSTFRIATREDIRDNAVAIRALEQQMSSVNSKLDLLLEHFGIAHE